MNEIKIFDYNSNQIRTVDFQKRNRYATLGALSSFLATALDAKSEEESWSILNAASIIGHQMNCDSFNNLYGAVAFEVVRKFSRSEFYYQSLFKERIHKVLANCSVINKKSDGRNIPDAWVKLRGKAVPVEVKLGAFDARAMKQLLRYMRSYCSGAGIAVGKKLTVAIPKNVIFISLTELEDADGE